MRIRESIGAKLAITAVVAVLIALGASQCDAPKASADPAGTHCITTSGIWLGKGTKRDLCDTARRADGSWTRYREFYTPAHTIAATSSCYGSGYGYSSCTYYPARFVPFASNGVEQYEVSDAPEAVNKPLWDEPGWIGP
ncbi:hypothetical protein PHELEMICH_52 [Mycobacterium phage Phelemich]|uniref:CDGP domain-containing protein n=2 Tax=Acadianvirus reprobate TaxID=1982903 RepID=S5Z907_9CAUD|nr:hypothetical protein N847_gp52 [Mycobacterium phage Phelemich]YP_008409974.1 hypothetical protein REPROBATE_53 [Mycobacterium phage Reprobate]AGT12789.1 hypothetical protein REPROBATE_53 [Mycobacterium phage Reprobate]AGT13966.1 hypothetical protein PHELEMICH_52 [Mycobacterium phage Phelemich]